MAGIRDSKTVDGVTYHYDTPNGKVVRQTWTENGTEHVLDIVYDANGLPYACVYDGSRYYYVLNQQGDVIRIVGYLGATLCEYQYDAWGNVLAITGTYKNTIGKINPIRYRGYYYDAETGFYYLQSRYYDPSIGRFISADQFTSTGQGFLGYNMYAYCNNNPVINKDPEGTSLIGAMIGGAIGGAVISTLSHLATSSEVTLASTVDAFMVGAVTGAVGGLAGAVKIGKAIISVGAGFIAGVYTAANTDGGTMEKLWAGLRVGAITAAGTYVGSFIDTESVDIFCTAVATCMATLLVGSITEPIAVATQSATSSSRPVNSQQTTHQRTNTRSRSEQNSNRLSLVY